MASVEEICDEIALINKSQVVLSGPVDEVRNRFKLNTFNVNVLNDKFMQSPNDYSVISETPGTNHSLNIRIRKERAISNSELLTILTQHHEIFSFTEELPSMNDVFLQVVAN
jgi:ABC-2 type transport system ATP-binding protein